MNTSTPRRPASRRRALLLLSVAPAALLAGCGRKGPLYIEEDEKQSKPNKDGKDAAQ